MSEELIAALTGRINAFAQGDPGPVLDAPAVVEARDLFNRAVDPDGGVPLQVVHVVAWLHWCRHLALPEGQDQNDLQTAIRLFTLIAQVDPQLVPDDVRPYLAGADAGADPVRQAQAAVVLLQQVTHRADPAALNQAIALLTAAVAATPSDHPNHAMYLSNLGGALRIRFERTGAAADLDEAIRVGQEAVATAPDDHPNRAGYLSNLGGALGIRFERTGAAADLDEAIRVGREAVATAPDDHPNRAVYLSILGSALQYRFERTGTAADLDEAIRVGREAVAATPDDRHIHATDLSNLGGALRIRFERTGTAADLDEAIRVGREAVAATPSDHPNHAMYLSNLGLALQTRFKRTGATADLDEAIRVGQEAVAATPSDHPNHAMYLSNLGGALGIRFERTGAAADLDEAIRVGREAVAATPSDHPNHASCLSNLGLALQTRFKRTGVAADLDEAVRGWAQASQSPVAPVTARLTAAETRARALAWSRGPDASVEAYTEAVNLLPLLAWRGISHRDQQHLLHTHAASLARDGAACAIAADCLDLAVELLEAGRGVHWSQLLGTRTDLTALHQAAPELAEQLQNCRTVLEQPTADEHTRLDPTQAGEARMRAAHRFDNLVNQVRALPSTEVFPHPDRFLTPPPIDSLRPGVGDDPVAVVNISRWRCDALLLTHHGITPVKLNLTEAQIIDEANRYLEALQNFEHSRRTDTDRLCLEMAITTTLEWLWDHITVPVLNQLGCTRTPTGRWPRLWWCPTGALTALPVHAAGYHHTGYTVMDRVISSYTPTMQALAHARTRSESTHPARALIIVLPDTPGQSPLPGAAAERDLLTAHFTLDEARTVLTGADATRRTVLAQMGGHRWLHASCHGTQDLAAPTTGGLLPHDWNTAGLITVTDLTSPEHTGGEFAFLSACKTATGGVTNLDETINVAAAMQHAGWRHVIGTLWSVWDHTAAAVTDHLYPQLLQDSRLDPATAAHALHHTIRELRDTDPASPSIWAPFIHIGP